MAGAGGFVSVVVSTTTEQIVTADEADTRLDRWLKRQINGLPQSLIQKLLRRGQIRVNAKRATASHRLCVGDKVSWPDSLVATPAEAKPARRTSAIRPDELEALRQQILYEDEALLAINKPPGLAVQGGTKQNRSLDELVTALYAQRGDTKTLQPRLLHRLDKRTGGVVLFAKTAQAATKAMAQFRNRTVKKEYWAIVADTPPAESGTINQPLAKRGSIGGQKVQVETGDQAKEAITHWRVCATQNLGGQAGAVSWLQLSPETGRMHQLRVHLAKLGTPILGDGKYGGSTAFRALPALGLPASGDQVPLLLLARKISLLSPDTGQELTLQAPPFDGFAQALRHLKS